MSGGLKFHLQNGKKWRTKAICWESSPDMKIKRIKKKMGAARKIRKKTQSVLGKSVSLKGVDVHPQLPVLLRGKIERLSRQKRIEKNMRVLTYHFAAFRLKEPAGHFTRQNTNMKDPGSSDQCDSKKTCKCWYAWALAAKHPLLNFNALYLYKSSPPNSKQLYKHCFFFTFMHFLHACEWSTSSTSSQDNAARDKVTKRSTSKHVHNIREGAHPRLHQKPQVSPKFESFQYVHHWKYRSLNCVISFVFYKSCLCHAFVECCWSIWFQLTLPIF